MKKKILTALVAAGCVTNLAFAQDYQLFSYAGYTQVDQQGDNWDSWTLGADYYFDKKRSLGPLGEFEYINKTSHAFGHYSNFDGGDGFMVGGEAFIDQFVIGASFSQFDLDGTDEFDSKNLSLGYLINDNFLVKIDAFDPEEGDTSYMVSASYNHQISQTDYLGFTLGTDDETDYTSLSSRYFTSLGGGQYLTVYGVIEDDHDDNSWQIGADYHLTKMTSFGASIGDDSTYGLQARHFFTPNISLAFDYQSASDDDVDIYGLTLSTQF